YPRRERRDRLLSPRPPPPPPGQRQGIPHPPPLVRVFGQQPDRMRELALARVHAAHQHVEHEVDALHVAQPIVPATSFGGGAPAPVGNGRRDQLGDQIVARRLAARAHELLRVPLELPPS